MNPGSLGQQDQASNHRFFYLMAALCLLLLGFPLSEFGGVTARISYRLFFDVVVIAGLFAMRRSRPWFLTGLVLSVTSMAVTWFAIVFPDTPFAHSAPAIATANLAMGAFLLQLVAFVLRDLFSSVAVTADRLYGAVSAYMLLGVAFGFLYSGLEVLLPGSFLIGEGLDVIRIEQSELTRSSVLFYYSFVTLTTVGYGDITPVGPTAQMLAIWESLAGQLYLAILVARLVGLHIARSGSDGTS